MTIRKFIKLTQDVILERSQGSLSLQEAAFRINPTVAGYPFSGPAHPMIYKIADLAFDIAENYRSEKENSSDWNLLVKTLQHYVSGNWDETVWLLTVMYGEYSDKTLYHSYSIVISRQNGKTLITAASKELRLAIRELLPKVNQKQTDARYLQNLVLFLPKSIKGLKLINHTCYEYLSGF